MKEFKVGDVVQLKSGGPKMSVNAIRDPGNVYCQWFAGNKLESGHFDSFTLILVKDKPKE